MTEKEEFVNIDDKLNELEGKYYQVTVDENTNKVSKTCVSYNKKIPELVIFLQLKIMSYDVLCSQYTLTSDNINDKYLDIMGVIFTKNKVTKHSLNLVNVNNTDTLEVHLTTYKDKDKDTVDVIQKVEKYPGNNEILNYLLELLSHDKVKKIFD